MYGNKTRNALVVFFIMLISSLLLSACSLDEISNTIGGCCGIVPLPIAAVGLFFASRGRKFNLD